MFHNYSLDKRVIPMVQVSTLTENMLRRGHKLNAILLGTGISKPDLQRTDMRVTYRQRIQQYNNIIELMDEPGFWLDWGNEVSISDYGLLGYAMMSSATLQRAVEIAVKYHKMAGAMYELSFVQEEDEAILRIDRPLVGGVVSQLMIEELFLGVGPLISLLMGIEFQPNRINFNYPAPTYRSRYQKAFGCQIRFGQQYSEYRFDAKLLGQKLAAADSNVAKSCEESCRKLLLQMEIEEDLISRICHILLSTPGEFPRLDVIACRLSMGTRTLRRRLMALGTSYQKVLDDVKKELAIEYLESTSLSVQEISDLLGYSEVTNFRRAFVKWAALSPYQYRRQITDPPESE
ncbi:MAG: AraC family transcriptional regulator [Pseudomonadales bacterium]|nr:AraC family transcriptional regulator [Pseudomonadales bacterium]